MQDFKEAQPYISIAMPASGRVDLLKLTLDALSKQTYKNFEVVISDDSRIEEDRVGIKQALEDFAKETGLKTKYVFTEPVLYQAKNTNQAIKNTSYEYIHLLHSDDILAPECLETEARLLAQNPEVEFIYNDAKPFYDEFKPNTPKPHSYIEPYTYFKKHIKYWPPMPSGWCFKKDLYLKLGGFNTDYKFVCDWEFFYRVLKHFMAENKHLIRINKGHVGWRQHKNTVSSRLWLTFHKETYHHITKMYEREINDKYVDGVFLSDLCYQMKKAVYTKLWNDFVAKLPSSLKELPQIIHIIKEKEDFFNKVAKTKKKNKYGELFNHPIFKALNNNANEKAFKLTTTSFKDIDSSSILELTPFYTDSGSDYNELCLNFNNTMNLNFYQKVLENYKYIRVINPNINRFYTKTLNELFKYIKVGQSVEFAFMDNKILTADELIKIINDTYGDRLKLTHKETNNFKYNLITFECTKNDPEYYRAEHTGFSFGILEVKNIEHTKNFIESIENVLKDKSYEILIPQNKFAEELKTFKNVKIIEQSDFKNSSEIKNYLCEIASYSDIVISDAEYELTEEFDKYQFTYGVAVPKLVNKNGERILDWTFEEGGELKPLNYREYSSFTSLNQDIVFIRKEFAKKHKWDENIDDFNNIDFSQKLRQNGFVIELMDLKIKYTAQDSKTISQELIYNSEYEIIENEYTCGQKVYKIKNNKLIKMELV